MKKLILLAATTMLFATNANAAIWTIIPTLQNGDEGAIGFGLNEDGYGGAANSPTLGLVGWFTVGTNGGGHQIINARGVAPVNDYNCYGLPVGNQATDTCTNQSLTPIWNGTNAVFTGSINDDGSFMDLSWTGIVGSEVPFGTSESLFISGVNSGSYDASGNISGGVDLSAGYDADGFVCWNNPANGLPTDFKGRSPDFCGNGTGTTGTAPNSGRMTKFNRELRLGITMFTDNGDDTITIDMGDSTYSDCVADGGCTPDSNSIDVFAQWRVNVVPLPPLPEIVGGSASGIIIQQVICKSKGKPITIPINGASDSWECGQVGLDVSPGDRIVMTVIGVVE